jgi:hypothetical protein
VTINDSVARSLGLAIDEADRAFGRRPPGFHDIASLAQGSISARLVAIATVPACILFCANMVRSTTRAWRHLA